ncbi:WD40 repeat-like protein [Aureobasidium sp. EXF-10728]|nr:WD40 repeat-like protein [Aureobasidium sp. EXF-10728]
MDFPQLKAWLRLTTSSVDWTSPDSFLVSIYDIKFCPYSEPGEDPVFAAVAEREIYICKPIGKSATSKTNGLEVLTVLEDPDEDSSLNSVTWSVDADTDEPLVCVAGSGSKNIKIWNAVTGELVRILYGHGGAINDLTTSPVSPQILASCSADYSIRVWNLGSQYYKQPCTAIFSGESHEQTILSIAFHDNGKWLLSGGQDTMICLCDRSLMQWSIPAVPDENAGTDKPAVVVHPHFASIGMHSDYVDWFWGDLVLSKASTGNNIKVTRGEIMLWKIDGFFSDNDNPPEPPMPGYGRAVRSAFGHSFQRLWTLDMTNIEPFYMRFGLFKEHGYRPMLVMGNIKARFSFWDLQRFEERRHTNKNPTPVVEKTQRIKDAVEKVLEKRRAAKQVLEKGTAAQQTLTINTRAASATDSEASDKDPTAVAHNNKRKRGLAEKVLINNTTRGNSTTSDPSASGTTPTMTPESFNTLGPNSDTVDAKPEKPFRNTKNYIRQAAHRSTVVNCPIDFACRAIDWSVDGKWCVGVGDHGMVAIFGRWLDK